MNQSVCAGDTLNFTCVVMFTSGLPGPASWFTYDGNIDASAVAGHFRTDDSNGRSAPANVTTVLTMTNVSISDNGADYICAQGLLAISDTAFLTVFGELQISALYNYKGVSYMVELHGSFCYHTVIVLYSKILG